MIKTMTFSQCLSSLMEKHQLTLGNLALMIGNRADLKHILADDATPTKRSRIFEKLKDILDTNINKSRQYESGEIGRVRS